MSGGSPAEEVDGRTFFVHDGETADEEFLVGALALPAEDGEDPDVYEVIFVCCLDDRSLVALPQPAAEALAAPEGLVLSSTTTTSTGPLSPKGRR